MIEVMTRGLGASARGGRARANARVVAVACASSLVFGLVACNALTGASDLSTCDGCTPVGPGPDGGGGGTDGSMVVTLVDGGLDALPPSCTGSKTACQGNVAAMCVNDAWVKTTCPKTCDATTGQCADYPSCRNAAGASCAVAGGTSCCDTAAVPGGTFNRRNQSPYAATVSPFVLDKYEVTVGRMRAFVDAGGVTKLAPPAPGVGAHPKIPGSGWNPVWNVLLPADATALRSSLVRNTPTWTDQPGANERLPINDVSWAVAFAFCAWDGGRLPTYAEMNFASAGGSDQRVYPWSTPPTNQNIDEKHAAYNCNFTPPSLSCASSYCSDSTIVSSPCDPTICIAPATCVTPACTGCGFSDIAPVGSLPVGVGKWGHFDLAGNVAELVYDTDGTLPVPCADCVHPPPAFLSGAGKQQRLNANFIVTSGGWDYSSTSLESMSFDTIRDDNADNDIGFRCAR